MFIAHTNIAMRSVCGKAIAAAEIEFTPHRSWEAKMRLALIGAALACTIGLGACDQTSSANVISDATARGETGQIEVAEPLGGCDQSAPASDGPGCGGVDSAAARSEATPITP